VAPGPAERRGSGVGWFEPRKPQAEGLLCVSGRGDSAPHTPRGCRRAGAVSRLLEWLAVKARTCRSQRLAPACRRNGKRVLPPLALLRNPPLTGARAQELHKMCWATQLPTCLEFWLQIHERAYETQDASSHFPS